MVTRQLMVAIDFYFYFIFYTNTVSCLVTNILQNSFFVFSRRKNTYLEQHNI